jgi:glycosyltransferase involved in cell wall biosynthesis
MRVLQISTHSTLAPRYGGPIRSHHVGRCLESSGFEVCRIAVIWRTSNDRVDPREPIVDVSASPFWSSPEFDEVRMWGPYVGEFYFARAVAASPELNRQFLTHVEAASPVVILLEHPWTWPLVKLLPGVRAGLVRVVYSSHNAEAVLKRRMIADTGTTGPRGVLDAIEGMEHDLVTSAWATIACTQRDADVFRSWGGTRVIVANNGTEAKQREHLRNALPPPLATEHRFGLFVGSQYPPNTNGFLKYVAPALARLKPNQRIVVAGSVSDAIVERLAGSRSDACLDRRLISLGFVDDLALDALIANSSTLLLPIEYGGGSHLKTAEALASGRPIIGTTASFRGFSEYTMLERVSIADTPDLFAAAIYESLSRRSACLQDFSPPTEVLWDLTLSPLVHLMSGMKSSW